MSGVATDTRNIYVAIKPEYLRKETKDDRRANVEESGTSQSGESKEESSSDPPGSSAGEKRSRDDRDNSREERGKAEFKKLSLKNRHAHTHPSREERLCGAVARGEPCSFGATCRYVHDVRGYLDKKPADIAASCYMYDTFGHCPAGFMCRFGDAHIDRVTLTNKTRPDMTERPKELNALSKEVQVLLRRRDAYFDRVKQQKQSSTVAASTLAQAAPDASTETMESSVPTTCEDNDVVESTAPEAEACCAPESEDTTNTVTETKPSDEEPAPSSVPSQTQPAAGHQKQQQRRTFDDLSAYSMKPVKLVDFSNKVYVAPLTTVGNLPFRRILRDYGADITCGEMAMAFNLVTGQASEWALLRKHPSETGGFGVQVAGNAPDLLNRCSQLLERETETDFVDLNCGCPIDVVCNRGAGSALMNKTPRLLDILRTMSRELPSRCVTVKVRTGWEEKHPTTHKLIPQLQQLALIRNRFRSGRQDTEYDAERMDDDADGAQYATPNPQTGGRLAAVFIHGRSRLQRYSKLANWEYVLQCAQSQDASRPLLPVIGNGDLMSVHDWNSHRQLLRENVRGDAWEGDINEIMGLTSCAMLGRGALIKPWLPQEIKEGRDIDLSASQRLEMLQRFCNYGLEHWGSDTQGVNTTRRFLLEWLSFLHRYVPSGLTEHPQVMNQRPPPYFGRNDLETLLSSPSAADWIKISEMLLGPVQDSFNFVPKHKSNSYASETGEASSNG